MLLPRRAVVRGNRKRMGERDTMVEIVCVLALEMERERAGLLGRVDGSTVCIQWISCFCINQSNRHVCQARLSLVLCVMGKAVKIIVGA